MTTTIIQDRHHISKCHDISAIFFEMYVVHEWCSWIIFFYKESCSQKSAIAVPILAYRLPKLFAGLFLELHRAHLRSGTGAASHVPHLIDNEWDLPAGARLSHWASWTTWDPYVAFFFARVFHYVVTAPIDFSRIFQLTSIVRSWRNWWNK